MPAFEFGHFDGPKLAKAREAAGMSRAQLAEAVGVKPDVVGLWEGRGVTPAAHHLPKAAAAVGLGVFDLYSPPEGTNGLTALRVRAGLSQRRLAQLVGVPQTTLSGWERGTSPLPEGKAPRLAEALGVSADEVFAAANSVRPDSRAPAEGSREPSRATATVASTTAHMICLHRGEGLDGSFTRPATVPWRVYSPQGVDFDDSDNLFDLLTEAADALRRRGYTAFCTHSETEVVVDGEALFVLRAQTQPRSEARMKRMHSLFEEFVRGTKDKARQDRVRAALPEQKWGKRLLIVVEPEDTVQWLLGQVWPDKPYTIVLTATAEADPHLIAICGTHVVAVVDHEREAEIYIDPDEPATIGDVVARLVAAATSRAD